jgi:hypothetical protein
MSVIKTNWYRCERKVPFRSLEEVNHMQLQYITMLFTSVPLP